jgi:hypothetical protein
MSNPGRYTSGAEWAQEPGSWQQTEHRLGPAVLAVLSSRSVPTWIAICACGCVSAAETTDELMLLLDTHRTQASPGQLQTVTIKGQLVISYQSPSRHRPSG